MDGWWLGGDASSEEVFSYQGSAQGVGPYEPVMHLLVQVSDSLLPEFEVGPEGLLNRIPSNRLQLTAHHLCTLGHAGQAALKVWGGFAVSQVLEQELHPAAHLYASQLSHPQGRSCLTGLHVVSQLLFAGHFGSLQECHQLGLLTIPLMHGLDVDTAGKGGTQ